ncbi:MAG TPA: tRNA (adenosine(37)-N6)-dimethylallyltransferase MiaA [Planctomycetota bacterium]|nr:tRNA (adenosine(37)-N6)-dimethylallyltransferase MiaA [Planctomycetota bacterium]
MDPLLVLVGPTASGKSGAAIPLARALGAEIVSLDSMLLYRGMDIGTDKPRDLGGIPHHGIDLLDPKERFDVRRYIDLAEEAIAAIRGRGRRVLVVGGTGLYLMALLKGIFEGPRCDVALRARLAAIPSPELHERLKAVDPATAAALHPNDRRRITRALEVYEATGTSLRAQQTQFEGPDRHPSVIAGIRWPREVSKARIRARVEEMFRRGLVDEVRRLDLGPTASQAVGYKEVLGHLAGAYDLAEAKRLVERNTIRLARRQETWFKRFPVTWVDGGRGDLMARLLAVYRPPEPPYLGSTTE